MATPLAGCVVAGVLERADQLMGPQDLRHPHMQAQIAETQTKWIRLWAPWPTWQPEAPAAGTSVTDIFAQIAANPFAQAVEAQILLAKSLGLGVILTSYKYPRWANGTSEADLTAMGYVTDESWITPLNRKLTEAEAATVIGYYDRAYSGNWRKPLKGLEFGWPQPMDIDSAWGTWVSYLCHRFGQASPTGAHVDVLEVLNEPNKMNWPQQWSTGDGEFTWSPNGPFTVVCNSASLMVTAQIAQQAYQGPIIGGPCALDVDNTSRTQTSIDVYENQMLSYLWSYGFLPDNRTVWTLHNYGDMLHDRALGATLAEASVTRIRTWIPSEDPDSGIYWTGWPSGSTNSQVLLTEGGVLLNQAFEEDPAADPYLKQAALIERNAERMQSAPGVRMVSNYLLYTDVGYDSGLRNAHPQLGLAYPPNYPLNPDPPIDGAPRAAYWRWRDLHVNGTFA